MARITEATPALPSPQQLGRYCHPSESLSSLDFWGCPFSCFSFYLLVLVSMSFSSPLLPKARGFQLPLAMWHTLDKESG